MAEKKQTEKKDTPTHVANFALGETADMMNLAVDVGRFISENKLYQTIQNKEYVNIEGWQYAGARLGLVPIVGEVINLSNESEIKYSSRVSIKDIKTGEIVGAGFAICSNKEQGKKFYQEFAIASMSQTRSVGKAYRNMLAWIIRAAGYEPTNAEEMDYNGNTPEPKVEQPISNTPSVETKPTVQEREVVNHHPQIPIRNTGRPEVPAGTTSPPLAEPTITDPSETPSNGVKYASAKQKEEIIRLLNNPLITRQEKTKMLLSINKLDEDRATQAIAKLKQVIGEREEQSAAAS